VRCASEWAVVGIKSLHTAVFIGELASILWLLVSGLLHRRDWTVAVAAGAVTGEAVVFLANGLVCPLTPLAEGWGAAHGQVSDIFLPRPVARTIPIWSSLLVAVAIVLHARAWLQRSRRSRNAAAGVDGVLDGTVARDQRRPRWAC
jgi:hypothetical protein